MSTSKPPVVVAVVEDDAPSRTALGRLLRAAGFEPALFESAEAYIEASPRPRASSSTCSSPACRASSCSSGCAPHGPAPPIIVTTSSHEAVIQERAQQNGCAAFFWKPVDGHTLTATIASLANR